MRISDWSSDVCSSDLLFPNPFRSGRDAPCGREGSGMRSDTEIFRPDVVVGAQLVRGGGIHHLTLAHDVNMVDQLQGQMRVLLDQQDRKTLLLQLPDRSEEHTSELQSLMRISYAVFCLNKKKKQI